MLKDAWPLIGLIITAMQGPLHDCTSRPSPACLRNISAAGVELMRAIQLEHEAYSQLSFAVYCQVCSSQIPGTQKLAQWLGCSYWLQIMHYIPQLCHVQ